MQAWSVTLVDLLKPGCQADYFRIRGFRLSIAARFEYHEHRLSWGSSAADLSILVRSSPPFHPLTVTIATPTRES